MLYWPMLCVLLVFMVSNVIINKGRVLIKMFKNNGHETERAAIFWEMHNFLMGLKLFRWRKNRLGEGIYPQRIRMT